MAAQETQPPLPPPWARLSHTLHTPRLTLRTAQPSDAPAFTHLFSDPKNNPFGGVVGHTMTEEEQRVSLTKQSGPNGSTARGSNAWLVVILNSSQPLPEHSPAGVLRTTDGLLIGSAGFNEFHLEKHQDEEGKETEILRTDVGCLIDWRFHRRGYALETLEATVEYAFSELGAKRISAGTNVENAPWRRMMDIMVRRILVSLVGSRFG